MTVKELMDELSNYDPSRIVVMSSDAEGNSYSPLRVVDETFYVETNSYSGNIYDNQKEAEQNGDAIPCVALWPTN